MSPDDREGAAGKTVGTMAEDAMAIPKDQEGGVTRTRSMPIVLGGFDVEAILAGRKTRHLVPIDGPGPRVGREAPYRVGDALWVREALTRYPRHPGASTAHYPADLTGVPAPAGIARVPDGRAVWPWPGKERVAANAMPRWASRVTLRVVAVEVLRLRDEDREDVEALGIHRRPVVTTDGLKDLWIGDPRVACEDIDQAFSSWWEARHNPRSWCADDNGRAFEANPRVQAITFTVERQGDVAAGRIAA